MSRDLRKLAKDLKPFMARWIEGGAGGSAGAAGGAPSPHELEGIHHTGTLNFNTVDEVNIGTPADNHLLAWDSISGKWLNQTAAEAGISAVGHTHAHGDLGGVTSDQHHAQVHTIAGANHIASGLSVGQVIRASGATTFAWAQLQHTDLGTVTSDQHHARDHDIEGATHTASGLTLGHVMRASGAAAFSFAELQHGDLGGVSGDQHHAQAHVLAASGPHTGSLPLADLAPASRGSIIRRGATDWEEYAKGDVNKVLKAGVSDVVWGQIAYGELTGDLDHTHANEFTISIDGDDVDIMLKLYRTTGGNAIFRWNGVDVYLDKPFKPVQLLIAQLSDDPPGTTYAGQIWVDTNG